MSQRAFGIERYLNVRSAQNPTFSPDGRRVAFLLDVTGVPQVWRVSREGGWPEQLSFSSERVGTVAYSPADEQIIFSMDAGGNEREQLFLLSADGSEITQLTDHPDVIHSFGSWSGDGRRVAFAANREHPVHFHIYIRDLVSGTEDLVFEQDGSNRVAGWSPDDRFLLVVRANTTFDDDLFLVDLRDRSARRLPLGSGEAVYSDISWTPDGEGFYLISNADRDLRRIAHYDLASGELADVEEAGWEMDALRLSSRGDMLAFLVNADGYSQLFIRDLDTGETEQVTGLPPGVYGDLAWSPVRDELAFRVDGSRDNANVWLYDVESEQVRQLTYASYAGIPRDSLVEPELVRYESFDGLSIPAFLYRPLGSGDEDLPVVVDIHGGPEGQRRVNFNPLTQYLVNRGYAVLAPNVRGSAGYGKEYIHMDDVEKRMDTVKDIRAGVEWMISRGTADPERLAVMGGSYGGFMVLACITEYPDLWAAAVDRVGIANFITFLENTGPWRRHLREGEYGSLEHDRDFLASISPIHRADRIRTPLLVIHGANDPRVPVGETQQIVEAIRDRGGEVEYLLFDDEGHGLTKLPNKITAHSTTADFLDRHAMQRQS
ncbi:MAG: S9 family peptidase [Bacillota bacterium]